MISSRKTNILGMDTSCVFSKRNSRRIAVFGILKPTLSVALQNRYSNNLFGNTELPRTTRQLPSSTSSDDDLSRNQWYKGYAPAQ